MLLGVDIGTTTLKAALYDPQLGQVVRCASRPTPTQHPQPGWSSHDPKQLYDCMVQCIHEAASGAAVQGLAISSMAEAGVLLDAELRPTAPIIAWYDRRAEAHAAWIDREVSIERMYQITGQRASPSFGLSKLLWMRENQPEAFRRGAHWLPVPAYLLWRLSGVMAVDPSIASRTLLYDQRQCDWSTELLERFRLPRSLFPAVYPAGTAVGTLSRRTAEETGLPEGVLCALGGHDHLCAAFAAGGHQPGAVTDSTGSANSLLLLLPRFLEQPGLAERGYACSPHVVQGLTVLKGGLKAAGSAIDWLAHLLAGPDGKADYPRLEQEARQGIGSQAGPLWLPHLIGSGTPEGDRLSRAAAVGLKFEHTSGDLFRGMLESLAFWTRQNLDEMQALTGLEITSVTLLGGVTRLELLSRLKASILNRPVRIPQVAEAAAAGAALLAGMGCGAFHSPAEALESLRYDCRVIDPDPQHSRWYAQYYREAYLPLYAALKPLNEALERMQ
jgi:sugar (pentulose or hexulose) kinase